MRDLEQNTLTGAEETKLQYDYIEKAKSYIKEKEERLGRKLTCCVKTFGCQMNEKQSEAVDSIILWRKPPVMWQSLEKNWAESLPAV